MLCWAQNWVVGRKGSKRATRSQVLRSVCMWEKSVLCFGGGLRRGSWAFSLSQAAEGKKLFVWKSFHSTSNNNIWSQLKHWRYVEGIPNVINYTTMKEIYLAWTPPGTHSTHRATTASVCGGGRESASTSWAQVLLRIQASAASASWPKMYT